MSSRERTDHFMRVLRFKTNDLLTQTQVENIAASLRGIQCSILFTRDKRVFGERLNLSHVRVDKEHGTEEHVEKGKKIFGRFSFGQREIRTDIDGARSQKIGAEFDAKTPAAALIQISNIGYRDLSIVDHENLLLIYIPAEAKTEDYDIPDARSMLIPARV